LSSRLAERPAVDYAPRAPVAGLPHGKRAPGLVPHDGAG